MEWIFLLSILFLLYIVLLLPVTLNKLFTKLHIVNNYIDVCLLWTVNILLQLILLSDGTFFLMTGSLEVTHEIIFTIASVIQISLISSINWIRLRFYLLKPRMSIVVFICNKWVQCADSIVLILISAQKKLSFNEKM